jgi:protein tyrosine/serine phosphatase
MHPRTFGAFLALLCALLSGCVSNYPTRSTIPNFAAVNERQRIYRGGEPREEGWAYLKTLGVNIVVKLNTDKESCDAGARARGMKIIERPITTHQQICGSPDFRRTIERAVREMRRGSVFVHCGSDSRSKPNSFHALFDLQGGQDRTGLVVGCYRVWVEHTKKEVARAEMKSFHFHALLLPGLRNFWRDNVH